MSSLVPTPRMPTRPLAPNGISATASTAAAMIHAHRGRPSRGGTRIRHRAATAARTASPTSAAATFARPGSRMPTAARISTSASPAAGAAVGAARRPQARHSAQPHRLALTSTRPAAVITPNTGGTYFHDEVLPAAPRPAPRTSRPGGACADARALRARPSPRRRRRPASRMPGFREPRPPIRLPGFRGAATPVRTMRCIRRIAPRRERPSTCLG